MRNKKIMLLIALAAVSLVILSGCVPGDVRYTAENPAGFFWGLRHGLIVWISFFIGIFTGGDRTIYETANTGWTYNLGFLLGVGSHIGGISGGLVRININSKHVKVKKIEL